jgi:hypothetical protein
LAIVSLVLGIVSIFSSCLGALIGPAALVTGYRSRKKARELGTEPSGMALAGMITGGVGAGFGVAVIVFYVAFFGIFAAAVSNMPPPTYRAPYSAPSGTVVPPATPCELARYAYDDLTGPDPRLLATGPQALRAVLPESSDGDITTLQADARSRADGGTGVQGGAEAAQRVGAALDRVC